MPDLRTMLKSGILLLDGATGTQLQKAGMEAGVCPELWILKHPDVMLKLQQSYAAAGSQILYAPTFSANAVKLEEYGVKQELGRINQQLVQLTRRAAGSQCLVAGNLTMTGRALAPVGDLEFEALVDCYKEQVQAIVQAGADLFVVETMMSIQECRAAVLAVKECTDLPLFVTITLEEDGRTLYGTDPVTALIAMEALGVDAFGINCSCGPDRLLPVMQELSGYARIPLIAKPNAGLPRLVNGRTVFDMDQEAFALHMKALIEAGASVVGGCCGTDASYIARLADCLQDAARCGKGRSAAQAVVRKEPAPASEEAVVRKEPAPVSEEAVQGDAHSASAKAKRRILTSERSRLEFSLGGPFQIVGERINPTGKKRLQQELYAGSLELVTQMALEQKAHGASVLDLNVGLGGIDEQETMVKVMQQVSQTVDLPLCVDSSDPGVVEAALRQYPGRALVNSISCEPVKQKQLLPVVKKYGAMFILLPLSENGMPKNAEERWENIQTVLKEAYALGFEKEDIIVDALATSAAAEPGAAREILATIELCARHGLATILGLSNISFGLPGREYVNSVFLAMAMERGLTMAIANPSQELFIRSSLAADLLMGKEEAAMRYVEYGWDKGKKEQPNLPKRVDPDDPIYQDVLKGRKQGAVDQIRQRLAAGADAKELLNKILIPAIETVGELFNRHVYFLPQLIAGAKAMEAAVAILEPALQSERSEQRGPVVVLATVKGDIHDIGKNLVALMMKNNGFAVIDLGKDVDKEQILEAARTHHADFIGLSALMTTTMSYMKEVIEAVHAEGLAARVIVGGAAVTAAYARSIGADGYSKDAVEAVELVKELLG